MRQRFVVAAFGPAMKSCHPAQKIVVGVEAFGRLAPRPLDFGLLQFGRDGAHHARRHLILQVEDILQHAIETLRPQMRSRAGIDELPGDAHLVSGLAHAALKHVADPQFAPHPLHIHGPALVCKARIARDHEQAMKALQGRDDLLDHTVGEKLLLEIAAHVLKPQDGDRRLVGKR